MFFVLVNVVAVLLAADSAVVLGVAVVFVGDGVFVVGGVDGVVAVVVVAVVGVLVAVVVAVVVVVVVVFVFYGCCCCCRCSCCRC